MTLRQSIERREKSIIEDLLSKKSGIDDRTGKGTATERVVQEKLLDPFLPMRFKCLKGSIVTPDALQKQSEAIDRVIYDLTSAPPLVHDEAHSVFSIEAVVGLVEITMSLDKTKLRKDIEHMAVVKAMRTRRYLAPVPGTTTKAERIKCDTLSPRSYVIGLPEDSNWSSKAIAQALRDIQRELGPPTHVHGLYVLGIGFFVTVPVENEADQTYRIKMWSGPDRLFRFSDTLRQDLDRWPPLQAGWSVDVAAYVEGEPEIIGN